MKPSEPRDGLVGAFLYWLGGFDKPNSGTIVSSAIAQTAVPNGTPKPMVAIGVNSASAP